MQINATLQKQQCSDLNAYLGDKMQEGGPMCNYAQLLDLIVK